MFDYISCLNFVFRYFVVSYKYFFIIFPDKDTAPEVGSHAFLSEILISVVRPLIQSLFVG